ncbi:MAG TPA: hypothetical protein VFO21_03210 [Vicinamibacterales bacterium]|nr:hypothetical protein [Vicinamibacterales bacterium]
MASSGANWELVPKLVEDALELPLEGEEIVNGVPTGHAKHGQLPPLSCFQIDLDHAWIYVKHIESMLLR